MDLKAASTDNVSGRILSVQLVNLHVYIVPLRLWRHNLRSALNQVMHDAISAGFVRVLPQTTVYDLRTEISNQLEIDLIPKEFVFLSCVGRCFTKIKAKQEKQLKVKSFIPPQAALPEIFILESDHQPNDVSPSPATCPSDVSRCSSLLDTELSSYRQFKLPPIGQPQRSDIEKHKNVATPAEPSKNKNSRSQNVYCGSGMTSFDMEKYEDEEENYNNESFGNESFADEEMDKKDCRERKIMESDEFPAGRIIFEFFKSATRQKILARKGEHSEDMEKPIESKCPTCAHVVHDRTQRFREKNIIIKNNSKGCSDQENKVLCVHCHHCLPASDVSNGNDVQNDNTFQNDVDKRSRTFRDDGENDKGTLGITRKESDQSCCLVKELNNLRRNKEELENVRDELLTHKKSLLAALKNTETKTANKDTWRKNYFIEKKRTFPVEENNSKLKKHLETLNKKIISFLEQNAILHFSEVKKNQQNKTRTRGEEEITSMHLRAIRLQHETEMLFDKLENYKIRLNAEMKLRVQVEKDVKLLKMDLEQKKTRCFQFQSSFTEELPC